MTWTTTPCAAALEDSEYLRGLLIRLHLAGPDAWRVDAEATALMEYAAFKYAGLARRHGLDAWELASAAFVAMCAHSTVRALDPWAVVTRAVQVTAIAEERGQGLLCSTHQARRRRYSQFHDPQRLSDRDNPLTDYHPAFHVHPFVDTGEELARATVLSPVIDLDTALNLTVEFFTVLGWPSETARAALDYVASRLAELSSRASAYEVLRRERHAHAVIDIPAPAWTTLLRVVLGNPDPVLVATATGRGVLLRLLIGEPLSVLLADEGLAATVQHAAPGAFGGVA
jgi:hypothetical protein